MKKGRLQLAEMVAFIVRCWVLDSRKLTEEEAAQYMDLKAWEAEHLKKRWPLLDLHACGFPDCHRVLVGPGVCHEHGGALYPSVCFRRGYLCVRVNGKVIEWHKAVFSAPNGFHVHHKDRNKWNNRPENLEHLTASAHWQEHLKSKPWIRKAATTLETTVAGEDLETTT